jgi:hypothetical protein
MRDPDQLPSVLHSLLDHPDLPELLTDTQTLVAYFNNEGWDHTPEEPTGADEDSEEWQTYFKRMEAWERLDSDYGEIMLAVEAKLGELSLLPAQEKTLRAALEQICPECEALLHVLMPSPSANT